VKSERAAPSVHLALVAVQLMFASLGVVAKEALRQLAPFALIAFRTPAAATIFLVAWLVGWREKVAPRDLLSIALYALTGVVLNQLLFIAGLQRTTATNAVVIGATIPVFTVGVAVLARKEQATLAKLVGLGVAFTGALVIVGVDRFQGGRLLGNLLIVANSLSFSIYLVISRRLLEKYRTMTVVTWTFVFGALGVLPFGARDLIAEAPLVSTGTWLRALYIVLFPTVGTYFLNAFALRRVPSSLVAVYIYLQPVVGALLAAWRLDERPSAGTYTGGALIAVGIWLVSRATGTLPPANLRQAAR
jgi:drug/metabolite transporter (DMT)-like permease